MARQAAEQESELLKRFRAVYEEGNRAWNEGDFKRAYGGLGEDIEYELAPTWPHARPLHGPDDLVAFFQDLHQTFPDIRAELLEFIQADAGTVIVGVRVIGTGGRSGVGTTMEIWQVWEIGEGLVPLRVKEFLDREAALGAAAAQRPAEVE